MTITTELAQRADSVISDMRLKHGDKDIYAPVMRWDEFLTLADALTAKNTENERMARDLLARGGEIEGLRQRIADLEARPEQQPDYFINKIESSDDYGLEIELRAYQTELDASKSRCDHGGVIIPLYTAAPAAQPVTVKLPEVRITIAESKRRGMTNRELNAHNSGALESLEKVRNTLTAAGITIAEGE